MAAVLAEANMNPIIPDGGYFLLVDFSKIAERVDFSSIPTGTKDYRFTKWLLTEKVRSFQFLNINNLKLIYNFCFLNLIYKKTETSRNPTELFLH